MQINLQAYTPARTLHHTKNAFASLTRSIIYQQISGKAAESIMKKFLSLFPQQSFPTPDDVLRLKDNDFKRAGVSSQKMSYLRDLAQKFNEKYINPRMFKTMSDEEIREHLVAVKGIGRWTADMFLIFALNRPNILPIGDLGIQNGFKIAFKLRARPNEKKMYALAKPYYGEWTKLSLYLWECADAKSSFRKS